MRGKSRRAREGEKKGNEGREGGNASGRAGERSEKKRSGENHKKGKNSRNERNSVGVRGSRKKPRVGARNFAIEMSLTMPLSLHTPSTRSLPPPSTPSISKIASTWPKHRSLSYETLAHLPLSLLSFCSSSSNLPNPRVLDRDLKARYPISVLHLLI